MKKHAKLLESSEQILRKLEEVRQTKTYEMMKYETIARMNAASVGAYLRQERLKPEKLKLPKTVETIHQKHKEERENQAAIIIQRFVYFLSLNLNFPNNQIPVFLQYRIVL